jgi:hypothetical protein
MPGVIQRLVSHATGKASITDHSYHMVLGEDFHLYQEIPIVPGIGEEREIAPFFQSIAYERNSDVPRPKLFCLAGYRILDAKQQRAPPPPDLMLDAPHFY